MKADFERDHDSSDLIELEGINDLYRLLNIEMDTQIDCFIYKGLKYKLNLRQDAISQNLYKFLASSIPKNIAKRISDEEKTQDLNRTCKLGSSTQSVPICKERPNTATGRMFGTVSGEINPENQIKASKIETPNGCICREEIKRIEKEFSAKQEEIYKLKKMIK